MIQALFYGLLLAGLVFIALFSLTIETPRASGGYFRIIQGGISNWIDYTQIREVASGQTIIPGRFVSGNGETDNHVALANAGDADTSFVELALKRVGAVPQDLDTGATVGQFIQTLRLTGGHILVAAMLADSTTYEQGTLLMLEADGMAKLFAHAANETLKDVVGRLATAVSDSATTDQVELMWI